MRTAKQRDDLAVYTRAYNDLRRAQQEVERVQTRFDRVCAGHYAKQAGAVSLAEAEGLLADATSQVRYLEAAARHLRLFT